MKYLFVLVFLSIDSVLGSSIQNETAMAFPLSEDIWERQVPLQEAIGKIGISTHSHDTQDQNVGTHEPYTKMFPRPKRDFGASAVVGLVSSLGLSTAGFISTPKYNRNFVMRIENLLKLPLYDAKYIVWWGEVSSPPHNIRPCEVGNLGGHKKAHTATGTSGIVSWKIKDKDLTVILLWSVPFNLYKCNSLGLAIYKGLSSSEPSYGNRKRYFHDIYYYHDNYPSTGENEPKTINTFCHRWHNAEFCTSNSGIIICGTLSNSKSAKFDIKIAEADDQMYCAGNGTNLLKPSQRGS